MITRSDSVLGRNLMFLATGAAVACAAILFCFDPSEYHFYPTCIFHQTTGLLCPGCGSLRAMHQMLHGHLMTAFRFNPPLVVALPFLGGLGMLYRPRKQKPLPQSLFSPRWLWAMGIILLAFTIWRNLPGAPALITPP